MPTRVERLKIDELSLVDSPANQHSRVTLFKRATHLADGTILPDPLPPNPLLSRTTLVVKAAKPARTDDEAARRVDSKPASSLEIDDDEDRTMTDFQSAVDAARNRARLDNKKMSRTAAMSKARLDHPALFDAYQAAPLTKAAPTRVEKDAITKFERLVDGIQDREKCSRVDAFCKAARRYPAEREAYSNAV